MEGQVTGFIAGIVIALLLFAIFVFIFRWLWNSTMPDVFGFKQLSFGQSLKILILAGILFGGHRVVEVPQEVTEEAATAAAQAE